MDGYIGTVVMMVINIGAQLFGFFIISKVCSYMILSFCDSIYTIKSSQPSSVVGSPCFSLVPW